MICVQWALDDFVPVKKMPLFLLGELGCVPLTYASNSQGFLLISISKSSNVSEESGDCIFESAEARIYVVGNNTNSKIGTSLKYNRDVSIIAKVT